MVVPAAKYLLGHWSVTPGRVSKLTMLSAPSAAGCVLVKPIISWERTGTAAAPGTPFAIARSLPTFLPAEAAPDEPHPLAGDVEQVTDVRAARRVVEQRLLDRAQGVLRVAAQLERDVIVLERHAGGIAGEADGVQYRELAAGHVLGRILRPRGGDVAPEVRQPPCHHDGQPGGGGGIGRLDRLQRLLQLRGGRLEGRGRP